MVNIFSLKNKKQLMKGENKKEKIQMKSFKFDWTFSFIKKKLISYINLGVGATFHIQTKINF